MSTLTDITLATAIITSNTSLWPNRGEFQLFYYYYDDQRDVVKTDNRFLAIREADEEPIEIHNFGFHWLQLYTFDDLTFDTLLWAVVQRGDWGQQDHRAAAGNVEAGVRFENVVGHPWLRAGFSYGSGDNDSEDSEHNTFFQMLPARRRYAMTSFYNMLNNSDLFAQLIFQPAEKISVRCDAHALWVSNDEDLRYAGPGAFSQDAGIFGYRGTEVKQNNYIGTLLDITIRMHLNDYAELQLYYGHLFGSDALEGTFVRDSNIDYGFIEVVVHN